MDTVVFILVLSTLTQLVVPEVPSLTFRAVAELVSGESRVFSGESIKLRCSIPDDHRSTWSYLWFRGSEQLPQSDKHLVLWKARVQQSGKYYCQGLRDTAVGNILTLKSLPVNINVDGGWAILQISPHPSLVGYPMNATCRVRANPELEEVFLYKDGVEIMRQKGHKPHFFLNNLTLKDQGMYSCRASWDIDRRTRSVISSDIPLQVLEVLSEPVLEIVTNTISGERMKLICHVQYNAPAPAPPVNYFFYKNNNRLGTATSENHDLVRKSPGVYSCRAKVPGLNISRWSEPKRFGQVTGGQMMMPQSHHPRHQWTLAPPVSSPNLSGIRPSDPLLKPSLPSAVESLNQTVTTKPINLRDESGDMSGDFAKPDDSDDV